MESMPGPSARRKYLVGAVGVAGVLFAIACVLPSVAMAQSGLAPPAFLIGEFEDDYENSFTVSEREWVLHQSARYVVEVWHPEAGFVVLQNHESNPGEAGLWTRIDWIELDDMAPWRWAFCMTVYDAPSAAAAQAVVTADREHPRTGCNGFPFSRMKPERDGYDNTMRSR
jgi:hypothetical protein